MNDFLRALRGVDFEWTAHLDAFWSDSPFDVPAIQGRMRAEVV